MKYKKNLYITDYFYLIENPHKELKYCKFFENKFFKKDKKSY